MKRKLFLRIFLLTFIVLSIFTMITGFVSFKVYEKQQNQSLRSLATLIRIDKNAGLSNEAISYKYSIVGNISFINKDGVLITSLDSGIDKTESLLSREEVKEALKTGEGTSIRLNENNKQFYFYKAFKIFNDILLIAIPIATFKEVVEFLLTVLLIIVILTVIFGYILAYYFYYTDIKPVEILERYVRKKFKDDSIPEIDMRNLPTELKSIAKTFKKTKYKLEKVAKKEQEKKMYLMTTINSMEDGLIVLDENNVIKLINNSARTILDLKEEDDFKDNILMITQNMDLFTAISNSGNQQSNQEITIGDKIYELSIIPLSQDNGKLILLNDITDLNKIENMRKEFVANVTHELKTPLTSIIGYVDTLKDGALEDQNKAKEFVEIIGVESTRLERLIEDILALSNIESQMEIKRDKITLNEIISEVINNYAKKAGEKNIDLKTDVENELHIFGNKELIKVMLSNLISNSLKYGKENGEIVVKAFSSNGKAIIKIRDNGIGIAQEDQERIFERFYKVDKSRSLDPDSTGLGLSIVKHIAKSCGGNVSLESELGEGTTIIIEIPLEGGK
ncbi:MAG: ATP-binding protein [Fusobacteria bacterium]|nr:ATP-binding protein [Fusobacteriota bacterium]